MKRLRADETVQEGSAAPLSNVGGTGGGFYRQLPLPNVTSAITYSSSGTTLKVVSETMQSSLYPTPPISYGTLGSSAVTHSTKPQAMQPISVGAHAQMRAKGTSPPTPSAQQSVQQPQQQQQQQQQSPGSSNIQRLKVEDALSYLDLVKFKFGDKPQVYNDFLDIMKEFKSQSIDTPGVIQRVSNLFNGFPDLIVGFNTFLPPGYKIEVQKNDRGYAFQVSVSVPSPTGALMPESSQKQAMILTGSGTIIHSNVVPSLGQPAPIAQSQALSLSQPHVAQVVPAQQQQQPPSNPAALHHASSAFTGSAMAAAVTLHNNSTHNALQLSAAQAAVNQALQGHTTEAPQNQPVEFNHAINYVNKIKNRFFEQPEKYKRFLEILHTYQKEQRTLKESSQGQGGGKHLTEQEVYSQVAKLFENQSDLLAEFGQFLPDATSHITPQPPADHAPQGNAKKPQVKQPYQMLDRHVPHKPLHMSNQAKRSPPYPSILNRDAPPPKKHKLSTSCRDVTLAEAAKYGSLSDYAFFDKVRKAVRSQEVYTNFLRCLTLFNQEIVSKTELIQLVSPFLIKYPELLRWFKEFLGQNDVEPVPYNVTRIERPQGDHALDIDYSTAKRLGRTTLCNEVLNNQWVSFPSWAEDNSFVGSRKNQYEEYMYRCEDERFELDVVIETNASTIRVLEGVAKKVSRMTAEESARFKLDDCLGGSSPVLHQRALKRIYGEKAQDMIDGLKRNPVVAVPVVLRRLKSKEEEWREAQKGFNKIWREQNEKYYLKSLDYQGINFKQNDVKALRSKSLMNEIETVFEERNDQNDESSGKPVLGPHMVFHYRDKTILDDAANLLIHHVKRQTGIQKGEKRRIKHILRQFIPDLFFHPRQQLSDDEREDDDDKEEDDESPKCNSNDVKEKSSSSPGKSPARAEGDSGFSDVDVKEEILPLHAQNAEPDEAYTLFMASNNWYIFLRLHVILCERLSKVYERAVILADEELKQRSNRKESTALALRLKPKPQIEVEDYYPAFLDMVKNLLDGNMESSTYEDTLREMFGIHAYIAFTLDKVVSYAVRQLQHCVTERTAINCMEMFQKEQKRGSAGGACTTAHRRIHQELAYQHAVEKVVQDENCFKIYIYKKDCRLTIEMIDTDPDEHKKLEEAGKWSTYKENYVNCVKTEAKEHLPLFLHRNLRRYKRKGFRNNSLNSCKDGLAIKREPIDETKGDKRNDNGKRDGEKRFDPLEELERKLNERNPPERNQSNHSNYEISDETECKFNTVDSKIIFTANKDSVIYKCGAFRRARQTHPTVTKNLSLRFYRWLKKWVSSNVSDAQHKQCTDWLMGRCENVVPNRTRIHTNNDVTRTPYAPYNRYRVERLKDDLMT